MKDKANIVYMATHLPTGKRYVGHTSVSLLERIGLHLCRDPQVKFHQFLKDTEYSEWKWEILWECYDAFHAKVVEDMFISGLGLTSEFNGSFNFARTKHPLNKGINNDKLSNAVQAELRGHIPVTRTVNPHKVKSGRKILCTTTGQIFNSITEAQETLNCDRSSIRHVLRGTRKQINGYQFVEIETPIEN